MPARHLAEDIAEEIFRQLPTELAESRDIEYLAEEYLSKEPSLDLDPRITPAQRLEKAVIHYINSLEFGISGLIDEVLAEEVASIQQSHENVQEADVISTNKANGEYDPETTISRPIEDLKNLSRLDDPLNIVNDQEPRGATPYQPNSRSTGACLQNNQNHESLEREPSATSTDIENGTNISTDDQSSPEVTNGRLDNSSISETPYIADKASDIQAYGPEEASNLRSESTHTPSTPSNTVESEAPSRSESVEDPPNQNTRTTEASEPSSTATVVDSPGSEAGSSSPVEDTPCTFAPPTAGNIILPSPSDTLIDVDDVVPRKNQEPAQGGTEPNMTGGKQIETENTPQTLLTDEALQREYDDKAIGVPGAPNGLQGPASPRPIYQDREPSSQEGMPNKAQPILEPSGNSTGIKLTPQVPSLASLARDPHEPIETPLEEHRPEESITWKNPTAEPYISEYSPQAKDLIISEEDQPDEKANDHTGQEVSIKPSATPLKTNSLDLDQMDNEKPLHEDSTVSLEAQENEYSVLQSISKPTINETNNNQNDTCDDLKIEANIDSVGNISTGPPAISNHQAAPHAKSGSPIDDIETQEDSITDTSNIQAQASNFGIKHELPEPVQALISSESEETPNLENTESLLSEVDQLTDSNFDSNVPVARVISAEDNKSPEIVKPQDDARLTPTIQTPSSLQGLLPEHKIFDGEIQASSSQPSESIADSSQEGRITEKPLLEDGTTPNLKNQTSEPPTADNIPPKAVSISADIDENVKTPSQEDTPETDIEIIGENNPVLVEPSSWIQTNTESAVSPSVSITLSGAKRGDQSPLECLTGDNPNLEDDGANGTAPEVFGDESQNDRRGISQPTTASALDPQLPLFGLDNSNKNSDPMDLEVNSGHKVNSQVYPTSVEGTEQLVASEDATIGVPPSSSVSPSDFEQSVIDDKDVERPSFNLGEKFERSQVKNSNVLSPTEPLTPETEFDERITDSPISETGTELTDYEDDVAEKPSPTSFGEHPKGLGVLAQIPTEYELPETLSPAVHIIGLDLIHSTEFPDTSEPWISPCDIPPRFQNDEPIQKTIKEPDLPNEITPHEKAASELNHEFNIPIGNASVEEILKEPIEGPSKLQVPTHETTAAAVIHTTQGIRVSVSPKSENDPEELWVVEAKMDDVENPNMASENKESEPDNDKHGSTQIEEKQNFEVTAATPEIVSVNASYNLNTITITVTLKGLCLSGSGANSAELAKIPPMEAPRNVVSGLQRTQDMEQKSTPSITQAPPLQTPLSSAASSPTTPTSPSSEPDILMDTINSLDLEEPTDPSMNGDQKMPIESLPLRIEQTIPKGILTATSQNSSSLDILPSMSLPKVSFKSHLPTFYLPQLSSFFFPFGISTPFSRSSKPESQSSLEISEKDKVIAGNLQNPLDPNITQLTSDEGINSGGDQDTLFVLPPIPGSFPITEDCSNNEELRPLEPETPSEVSPMGNISGDMWTQITSLLVTILIAISVPHIEFINLLIFWFKIFGSEQAQSLTTKAIILETWTPGLALLDCLVSLPYLLLEEIIPSSHQVVQPSIEFWVPILEPVGHLISWLNSIPYHLIFYASTYKSMASFILRLSFAVRNLSSLSLPPEFVTELAEVIPPIPITAWLKSYDEAFLTLFRGSAAETHSKDKKKSSNGFASLCCQSISMGTCQTSKPVSSQENSSFSFHIGFRFNPQFLQKANCTSISCSYSYLYIYLILLSWVSEPGHSMGSAKSIGSILSSCLSILLPILMQFKFSLGFPLSVLHLSYTSLRFLHNVLF